MKIYRKIMVLTIIGLFIGAGVVPSIASKNDLGSNVKDFIIIDDERYIDFNNIHSNVDLYDFDQKKYGNIDEGESEIKNWAVIICGGKNDDCQRWFNNTANYAKRVFDDANYKVSSLYHPTKYLLKKTITSEFPENVGQIFLFFIDHGYSNGVFQIRDGTYINPVELDEWTDNMANKCDPSVVTILIDACFSGYFINELCDYNRVIITSTDKYNYGWGGPVYACFSYPFFRALDQGETYADAWETADKSIDGENAPDEIKRQNPQIEDNGNGVPAGTSKADTLPIYDRDTETNRFNKKTWDGYLAGQVYLSSTIVDDNIQENLIQNIKEINTICQRFLENRHHLFPVLRNIFKL